MLNVNSANDFLGGRKSIRLKRQKTLEKPMMEKMER